MNCPTTDFFILGWQGEEKYKVVPVLNQVTFHEDISFA
jgi:hypothetical protein